MTDEIKREQAISNLETFCKALVREGRIRSMNEIFDRALRVEKAGKRMRDVLSRIQFPTGSSELAETTSAVKAWDEAVES